MPSLPDERKERQSSERSGLLKAEHVSQDSLEDPMEEDELSPTEELKFASTCSRMDNVYIGWEVCGRRLHWSEGVLLFALLASLGLSVLWTLGLRFPAFLYAAGLALFSLLSLWFVWGVANIRSFAKLAGSLEQEQRRIDVVTGLLRRENAQVHEGTLRVRQGMQQIARDLGLMDQNLDQLDEVSQCLRAFAEAMAEAQREQARLNLAQREKIVREDDVHRDERARQTRDRVLEWFDSAANRSTRISTPEQFDDLMELLEKSDVLQELEKSGKDWRRRVRAIYRDGVLEKWELIDLLNEAAETEFHRVVTARERRKELEQRLARLEKELQKASSQRT